MAWLDYHQTWSIAAIVSLVWVVTAWVFTFIDYFVASTGKRPSSIGALSFWILPVVIGWLQVSPKCDSKRLGQALDRVNSIAYVATRDGAPRKAHSSTESTLYLRPFEDDAVERDQHSTPPIFNYARALPWTQAVQLISSTFRNAAMHTNHREYLVPQAESKDPGQSKFQLATISEVEEYCGFKIEEDVAPPTRTRIIDSSLLSRIFVASSWALALQWGTTGAGVVVLWFRPPTGQ